MRKRQDDLELQIGVSGTNFHWDSGHIITINFGDIPRGECCEYGNVLFARLVASGNVVILDDLAMLRLDSHVLSFLEYLNGIKSLMIHHTRIYSVYVFIGFSIVAKALTK